MATTIIPIQQVISGQAIGSAISVLDSATLAQVGIVGLTVGTQVWNQTVGAYFALTVSSAGLVTDQIVQVAGVDGWRWVVQATGITPTQSAKLAAVDLFQAGTALTDASATITPAADKASEYTLPAATLTANRTLTLGVTGSPVTGSLVQITRRDLTAHTFLVQDDASTALFTFGSAPTAPQGICCRYNGTHYEFVSFFYVAV